MDNSLRRLGVDYIDLYQIRRFDPTTPIEETIEALSDLVDAGKVLYLGASSMYAWQFATMLHVADQLGMHRFATMQNHYNLLYREEEREMMPLCAAEGIAVIPWSPGVVPADLNVGVLFILAMGGLPVIGVIMAGWSSNNKYALLGGMRSAAQLISYEIPGVLAALVPVMLAGTMSLSGIVAAQEQTAPLSNWWFIFSPWGFIAFIVFLIAGIAETNRTPFDLP